MYLCGMPLLCIGSCGVATSMSLRNLLFWRFVQSFGCSGSISLGAGVIGDIYKLEERGTGIGIFFGVRDDCLNGSCIGTKICLRLRFLVSPLPRFLEVRIVIGLGVYEG
jgi:MFS family permease